MQSKSLPPWHHAVLLHLACLTRDMLDVAALPTTTCIDWMCDGGRVVLTTVRESSSMGAAFLAAAAKNAQGKQHRE